MKMVLLALLLLSSADPGAGSISKKAPKKSSLKRKALKKQKKRPLKVAPKRSKPALSALNLPLSTRSSSKLEFRKRLLYRLKRALPKGWRIQTKRLPGGLEGAAFGPASGGRRPVITVSSLEQGAPLSTPQERASVLKALAKDARLSSLNAIRAPRSKLPKGWIEIRAGAEEADEASEETKQTPQTIRYLIAQGDPTYILTVVAPASRFENTYNILVRGIQKLNLDPSARNR